MLLFAFIGTLTPLLLVSLVDGVQRGPSLTKEPPNRVLFYNNTGTVIPCSVEGIPKPTVRWVDESNRQVDEITGLRQQRKDGALVFSPFRADQYRLDVHAAVYRCTAQNSVGTVGSRTVLVRAVSLVDGVQRGPSLTKEPPNRVLFYNNTGTVIPCSVEGIPKPTVRWVDESNRQVDEITGLRQQRKDGALVFSPFRADQYRLDVHAAVYRCTAQNSVGTVGSRTVLVRAVIFQPYEIKVYDEYVMKGNDAVLRCHVPSYVKDYVTISAWIGNDGVTIYPRTFTDSSKKHTLLPTGELLIKKIQFEDSGVVFKCQTRNTLSGHIEESTSGGRLVINEPHTSVPPRILHVIRQVTVHQGKTAVLMCLAQGFPVPRYQWLKSIAGQLEYVHPGDRIRQVDGLLVIHQVKEEEEGRYFCLVTNDVGEEKEETQLRVTVPLSATIIPHSEKVNKGTSVVFNCTTKGSPIGVIEWRKDMKPISLERRISIVSRNVLQISAVERQDRGMYQCFVGNDDEFVQSTAELSVLSEPPLLVHKFPDITVHPGQQVSLKCSATGNPLPQITWTLYGSPVRDSHNLRLGDYVSRDGTVVSFVNISSVDIAEGGYFTCRAENDYGVTSHSGQLKLISPPYIRAMRNITAIAGQSIYIHCPVTTHPVDKLTWDKGGKVLPLSRRHVVFQNGTLQIQDVDRVEDVGKYSCTVQNKLHQKAHSELYIKVLVPPVITPIIVDKNLQEGMRTGLTCSVPIGDPPIRIVWLKDGKTFSSNKHGVTSETIEDFISTLVFKSLGEENSGVYTCLASNDAATVNVSVTVTVNASPRWKIEPHDTDVITNSKVVLNCQAKGRPEPRVLWKRFQSKESADFKTVISGSRIQTLMNGSLVFREVEVDDNGRYMCEASNGVGSPLSTVIRLNVHVPVYFNQLFEMQTVKRGDTVHLTCDAEGEEPITYVWFKEGQKIKRHAYYSELRSYTVRELQRNGRKISELMVENAVRSDNGLFICIASNAYGKEKKSIQLTVQEKPEPPKDVQIITVGSTSVTIAWKTPHIGNSPLTHYLVYLKLASDPWDSKSKEILVTNEQLEVTVQDLTPTEQYQIRVIAENAIGRSDFSDVITVSTAEEVPGGPPTNIVVKAVGATKLHVYWKPPFPTVKHGKITGYYIGYKPQSSLEPFVYKTVKVHEDVTSSECQIDNLQRFTKYVIVIQAFNTRGAGPLSDETVAETFEFDRPAIPILQLKNVSPTTIELYWERANTDTNPISGYVIHYKSENPDWHEEQMPGDTTSHIFKSMKCATTYQFYIYAFNRVGKGDPGDIMSVRTEGSVPISPVDAHNFVIRNISQLVFLLSAWNNGNCEITRFSLRYRRDGQLEWISYADHILPQEETIVLEDLQPGAWYNILMVAYNPAGHTEGEYTVSTLTETGESLQPKTLEDEAMQHKLKSLSIIVPILSVILVFIAVGLAIFFLLCRRRGSRGSNVYEGVRAVDNSKGEAIVLGEMDKSYDPSREQIYFPSPYAASKVPTMPREGMVTHIESPRLQTHGGRRGIQHVYDVPQPIRGREDENSPYRTTDYYSRSNGFSIEKANLVAELEGKLFSYREHYPLTNSAPLLYDMQEDKRWSTPIYSDKSRFRPNKMLRYDVYPISVGHPCELEFSDTECDRDFSENCDSVSRATDLVCYT